MSASMALHRLARHVTFLRITGGSAAIVAASHYSSSKTRLDYWHHDPNDFDLYIKNPTAQDLPLLLEKFECGQEVWPWIWTQPNENGPHYVFLGMNEFFVEEIKRIHAASTNNNILIVADETTLIQATRGNLKVLSDCQCGIVSDSGLALLNVNAKMLMLKDERVIAYDYLTIVDP